MTTPLLDHDAGFFQAVKDLQVQTLTAQFAIEALAPICNSVAKNVPAQQQHLLFVETIKHNRMTNTLDRIRANKGKLIYECVWGRSDTIGKTLAERFSIPHAGAPAGI